MRYLLALHRCTGSRGPWGGVLLPGIHGLYRRLPRSKNTEPRHEYPPDKSVHRYDFWRCSRGLDGNPLRLACSFCDSGDRRRCPRGSAPAGDARGSKTYIWNTTRTPTRCLPTVSRWAPRKPNSHPDHRCLLWGEYGQCSLSDLDADLSQREV